MGTRMVQKIERDHRYRPQHLRALGNGRVIFRQWQSLREHHALWASDGTRPGTQRVQRFPNFGRLTDIQLERTTSLGNSRALFAHDNGRTGVERWVTDGTRPGTRLLRNISREHTSMPQDWGFMCTRFSSGVMR